MECKYDYWGGMTAAGTAFPTLPGLFSSSSESWQLLETMHFSDIDFVSLECLCT